MMDDLMKSLVDAPLANALKINIPQGRRPRPKPRKAEYYDGIDAPKLTKQKLVTRRVDEANSKHRQMLDYYATTDVPFDRIATHCNMTPEQAASAMKLRGRTA